MLHDPSVVPVLYLIIPNLWSFPWSFLNKVAIFVARNLLSPENSTLGGQTIYFEISVQTVMAELNWIMEWKYLNVGLCINAKPVLIVFKYFPCVAFGHCVFFPFVFSYCYVKCSLFLFQHVFSAIVCQTDNSIVLISINLVLNVKGRELLFKTTMKSILEDHWAIWPSFQNTLVFMYVSYDFCLLFDTLFILRRATTDQISGQFARKLIFLVFSWRLCWSLHCQRIQVNHFDFL